MALMKFEHGGAGAVTGTEYWNSKLPSFRIEYVGTKGRAVVDDIVGELTTYPLDGGKCDRSTVWRPPYHMQRDMGILYRGSLAAFVQSIRKGVPPPVTGLDGLRYMQLRQAIIVSNEKNTPIKPY